MPLAWQTIDRGEHEMVAVLRWFCCSDEGATSIEYGLIAAMIVLGIMIGLGYFADENLKVYNHVRDTVDNVVSP